LILSESKYTYDVFDRLIVREANGQELHTVYNGEHAWADYDPMNQMIARYLTGTHTDEWLARWRANEGVSWYLTDHLGTVRDVISSNGTLLNHIT
jgi:hypothetical protein